MRINLLKTYPPEVAAFRKLLHGLIDRAIETAVDELRESPNIQPRPEDLRKMRERIQRTTEPLYEELARLEIFAEIQLSIERDEGPETAGRVFLQEGGTYLDLGTIMFTPRAENPSSSEPRVGP